MTGPALVMTVHDVSTPVLVDDCMAVMRAAFDPAYGEAWTGDQVRAMLDLPGARLIAGRVGDDVIGFALIRTILDEAELLLLGVHPTARRRGFGRAILDRATTVAVRDGATTMFLEVRDGNEAVMLYSSAAFQQYSVRRDYYVGADGQRRSALSFRKNLSA